MKYSISINHVAKYILHLYEILIFALKLSKHFLLFHKLTEFDIDIVLENCILVQK